MIDPGALLARAWPLDGDVVVRLRLPHRSDVPGFVALLARRGVEAEDFSLSRLIHFDPSRRAVICATRPMDGAETIVGVGAIVLEAGADPDTLVGDEALAPGVGELLDAALRERAERAARRVA